MKQYRLGLYEKAMPNHLGLEEKLFQAGRAGFDFVELSIDETDEKLARLDWTDREIENVREAMGRTGLSFGSICLSGHRKYPLGSPDPQTQKQSIEIFQKAVRLANRLGVRIIQLAGYDVYYEPGTAQTRQYFLENLKKCALYAAQYGVMLGFETMETAFMDTVEKAMAFVSQVGSPYLGVYPDLGNLTNAAEKYGQKTVAEDLWTGEGHLLAMHLKETVPGKYRDMVFGEGRVDFLTGAQTARDLGVRCFVAEAWDHDEADWKDRIRDINGFVRAVLGQVFETQQAPGT